MFGAIHPERGIDWEFFEKTAKEEAFKLAPGADLVYSTPLDSAEAAQVQQQEAPTLVAKLKDAGVTTVHALRSAHRDAVSVRGRRRSRTTSRSGCSPGSGSVTSRSPPACCSARTQSR